MKILVVLKQVPDSTTTIKITPDGGGIERTGVKMVVNPFDEFAIEQGVRLKEKRSDVESVTALIPKAMSRSLIMPIVSCPFPTPSTNCNRPP